MKKNKNLGGVMKINPGLTLPIGSMYVAYIRILWVTSFPNVHQEFPVSWGPSSAAAQGPKKTGPLGTESAPSFFASRKRAQMGGAGLPFPQLGKHMV